MRNQVQLITYVDRLSGGGFRALQDLLEGPFRGLFGGAHLLPFYWPIDGADAGFDPIDHTQPDSRLGSWDDVRALAEGRDLMADVIVNHVSSRSPQFEDFRKHGDASAYAGPVSDLRPRLSQRSIGKRSAPDLSPASGASVHEDAIG